MFDELSEKLEATFARLRGRGVLTEADIKEGLREVRRVLLEADVNFQLTREFLERVEKQAVGVTTLRTVSPAQQLVKIVYDELTAMLGEQRSGLKLSSVPPTVVMMVGLQGSGKTTTAGKLARKLKGENRPTRLIACDVYRPAAIDQLETLGEQLGVPVYADRGTRDVVKIAREGIDQARRARDRVVIVDTAGRLQIDEDMMRELERLKEAIRPDEILFVADGMTGQDAVRIAQGFDQALGVSGVILTKMDGDARGGAALSMRSVTGAPIKLLGAGEKLDALEDFHPDRIAGRILGMGDIVSLVERAAETIDRDEAEKLAAKMQKGQFDLEDYASQLKQIGKMGSLSGILGMLPGVGKMKQQIEDANLDTTVLKRQAAIIGSMTPKERRKPDIIKASRKRRIAAGSGTTVQEVNRLLKQFDDMSAMMKRMNKMGQKGLMRGGLAALMPKGMQGPGGGRRPF